MSTFFSRVKDSTVIVGNGGILNCVRITSNGFKEGAKELSDEQVNLVGAAIASLLNKMYEGGMLK